MIQGCSDSAALAARLPITVRPERCRGTTQHTVRGSKVICRGAMRETLLVYMGVHRFPIRRSCTTQSKHKQVHAADGALLWRRVRSRPC